MKLQLGIMLTMFQPSQFTTSLNSFDQNKLSKKNK